MLKISYLFILVSLYSCGTIGKQNESPSGSYYQMVKDWPALSPGYHLGQATGIGMDKEQNLYVFHRNGREWSDPFPDSTISLTTILKLDRETGAILNSWGENLFIMPHGLTVDNHNNIWVTDVALHQVFKISPSGQLLMKLGEAKVAGKDALHFDMPTDVAFDADASFYVADGYGNSRIIKFSAEGKYLLEWGRPGKGEGEFDTPHSIDVDAKGNVYVADRENKRIQKFDSMGKFLQQWQGTEIEYLYALTIDKATQQLFAVDFSYTLLINHGSNVLAVDSSGKLTTRFGRSGGYDGPVTRYHDIVVDKEGNIYVADILLNTVQKFRRVTK